MWELLSDAELDSINPVVVPLLLFEIVQGMPIWRNWKLHKTRIKVRDMGFPDGHYFTATEAGKKSVFWKSVLEAGILKIKYIICRNYKMNYAEPLKLWL